MTTPRRPRPIPLHRMRDISAASSRPELATSNIPRTPPPAPGDVDRPRARRHTADCDESERRLTGQIDRLQERLARWAVAPVRRPRLAISEPRRPVRGRDDRPVVRDQVQEIETLESREGLGFVDEGCVLSAAPTDLVRGAEDKVCRRQAIESPLDVFLLGGELLPELQNQRIGPLPIEQLERLA